MTKPPFEITPVIINLISEISVLLGQLKEVESRVDQLRLRKSNQIRTIHSTLQIEGNTLNEDQITALLAGERIVGRENEVREVLNAIETYKRLSDFQPGSTQDFLKCHKILMQQLDSRNGKFRDQGVGIAKGNEIQHIAPSFKLVPNLVSSLFEYLSKTEDHPLIVSCVVHYEIEFIHPFMDGNGRMGRLWQNLILMQSYPIFQHLAFESLILANQGEYYQVLSDCDKQGKSTLFIEFMLQILRESLDNHLKISFKKNSGEDRLILFLETGVHQFSRKQYLNHFKNISTATASRDLKKGIELGFISKSGNRNQTTYQNLNKHEF